MNKVFFTIREPLIGPIYNPTVLNKVYNIVLSRHNYFDEGIVEVMEARNKTSNSAV